MTVEQLQALCDQKQADLDALRERLREEGKPALFAKYRKNIGKCYRHNYSRSYFRIYDVVDDENYGLRYRRFYFELFQDNRHTRPGVSFVWDHYGCDSELEGEIPHEEFLAVLKSVLWPLTDTLHMIETGKIRQE